MEAIPVMAMTDSYVDEQQDQPAAKVDLNNNSQSVAAWLHPIVIGGD
jgi:hypothetical protein